MRHVKFIDANGDRFIDPVGYLDALPTFVDDLPPGARAFAADPEHYNFHGKRCVKDLNPDSVQRGETGGEPWLTLGFRHNCWKHDEDLTIHYPGVATPDLPDWTNFNSLVLDEVLPHAHGCSHEFRFLKGSLTVISRDLIATWTRADCPDMPA
ncbi:hypothetical protein JOD54_005021 [Actinokineospora baliensis]|uniref:hypothetical protein n=1 Tax=Actinokineospora baliensis TaxID=547056 RepID=UPI00195A7756|nr:hypothetical protein [Actinokineospora baliensis]MBM7774817.1 hypothetical protein [Actinokineospora baliensis]